MKLTIRITLVVALLYALLNYSWVHAASAAMLSEPCGKGLLTESRTAVGELYGSVTSSPIVRCISSPTLGQNVSHGKTSFGLGLRPVILIGPKGVNTDVIAHELGHAELFERFGFFHREMRIPVWLDEGLAMQLDRRNDYNLQSLLLLRARQDLKAPKLSDIASTTFFVAGDQGKFHYAYSRCVVGRWLEGNTDWLTQLSNLGSELPQSFDKAAQHCNAFNPPYA